MYSVIITTEEERALQLAVAGRRPAATGARTRAANSSAGIDGDRPRATKAATAGTAAAGRPASRDR